MGPPGHCWVLVCGSNHFINGYKGFLLRILLPSDSGYFLEKERAQLQPTNPKYNVWAAGKWFHGEACSAKPDDQVLGTHMMEEGTDPTSYPLTHTQSKCNYNSTLNRCPCPIRGCQGTGGNMQHH